MRSLLSSNLQRYSTALFLVTAKSSVGNNFSASSRIPLQITAISAFAPPPHSFASRRQRSTMTKARKKKEEFPPVPHVPKNLHGDDDDENDSDSKSSSSSSKLIPSWFNQERTKVLTTPDVIQPNEEGSCVYYWMQRDIRTEDNWALLYAEYLAKERAVPLKVVYVLPPPMPSTDNKNNDDNLELPPKVCEMNMTERHGSFLLGGLKIVEEELLAKDVPFQILTPEHHSQVGQCVQDCIMATDQNDDANSHACVVVCDFNPLRQYREWMETQAAPLMIQSNVPLYQVDAHNVVPVWFASPKREVGARTLRPRINKLFPEFMTHFPSFEGNQHLSKKQKQVLLEPAGVTWEDCENSLNLDKSVKPVEWAQPGSKAAMERFEEFTTSTTEGLKNFDTLRNDPNFQKVCSNLSPWVNYGQVSFQRLALEVRALKKYPNGTASYIEEGVVRRELSDNFVYYSQDTYDSLETAAVWAQDSLNLHAADEREYIYSLKEFQEGKTHDDLWNAAQTQLNIEGKMHGFLRMYWAKKILEWTVSPEQALRFGLYLNDRYALDGNDPNGFTGLGWSIMGIHDMGWKERPIFGKIRFMNYAGCKRKFKVDQFVARYNGSLLSGSESTKATNTVSPKKRAASSGTKAKVVTKRKVSKAKSVTKKKAVANTTKTTATATAATKKVPALRSNKRKILEHLSKKKSSVKKTKP